MSRMGGFDARELRKLRDELEKLQEPEEFMKDCAKELAARLLRMVVQRTPADTGTLRRAWTAGTSSEGYANSVQVNHSGNVYEIAITNPKEYASYVEYGHRTPNHKDGYQESL